MKDWSINSKVIALALLPTLIVSLLLGGYFTLARVNNINIQLETLGRSMISQLAPAAKYALLSDNKQILQGLTNSALENPQIAAAAIFNRKGQLLAYSGPDNLMPQNLTEYKNRAAHIKSSILSFVEPLAVQQITINDYSKLDQSSSELQGKTLGWISLDISSAANYYIKIQTALVTLIIITLGLILSLFIIRFIMHSINRPVIKLSRALRHLQDNNFKYKIPDLRGKEFEKIALSLNQIKQRLQYMEEHHNEAVTQEIQDLRQNIDEIEVNNIETNMALKQARRDNRRKSEFVASLSHEIRTPMSSIIGFTNLLLESELSKYQKEYLITIQKSANTLLSIINDILDFSKIEAGKFKLDNIPFDLVDTIDEVLQSLTPEAQKKRLELVSLIDDDIPAKMIGDPLRLKQIVTNLVYNAVKFTESGSVCFKASLISQNDDLLSLRIKVIDTGIGLSENDKKNLFKAFSQADISIARKFGGTGLGLVISKQLIEQMGGSIEISSKAGVGTTIQFDLKFNTLATGNVGKSIFENIPKSLLVYEPHYLSREALDKILKPRVNNLILKKSLKEVKTFINNSDNIQGINHIILSLASAELHNVMTAELLRYIKKILQMPVTVIINNSSEMIINDLMSYGATNCIVKPITAKKIVLAIKPQSPKNHLTESEFHTNYINNSENALNILVAEDNPANLKLITSLLNNLETPLQVDASTDGVIAFDHASKKKYDLILLDLQMPNMGGIDTSKAIRTHKNPNQKTPIIAISAFISAEQKSALFDAGFNELLIKPIDTHTLKCLLQKWCLNSDKIIKNGTIKRLSTSQLTDSTQPPLSLEKTIELAGGNKQIAMEIIQMFIQELPSLQKSMDEHYNQKNWKKLTDVVHKLHGSSRFCSMESLQQISESFEQQLRNKNYDNVDKQFLKLKAILVELEIYIKDELKVTL